MEMEVGAGVKALSYKVKAMSRESPSQKASHVLDSDLRTHWSTSTNTKEWILLELDEPCLLSHIRIYNKSVLEWEITAGLRYKLEAFVKVRPRCEAPRRDMMYPMNYTPCRYVRISCLRGNPIAIFFIQLIGVTVPALEPEFQPVVNYLLPHIVSHKQDAQDLHLLLLQDITSRLQPVLPHLEVDLNNMAVVPESGVRFFAMLAGPFYPILRLVNERDVMNTLQKPSDADASKVQIQIAIPTVSSNFQLLPRRSKIPALAQQTLSSAAFRSDLVIALLRRAFKDNHLGTVCRRASIILDNIVEPVIPSDGVVSNRGDMGATGSNSEEVATKAKNGLSSSRSHVSDYSMLFGEEYRVTVTHFDSSYLNLLDISAVEEGILHLLYASACQPSLCIKLAESNLDMCSVLPLIQALLPALRPPLSSSSGSSNSRSSSSSGDAVDDSFRQWNHSSVEHALSQIVMMMSSPVYQPLLRACAGYLSSYMLAHARAACVLIDLCGGPLSQWIPIVTTKVDLMIELLGDLLGVIQGAWTTVARSRAALKYVILGISGHVDDVLPQYKEVKQKVLFLVEMLDMYLDPAITASKNTIAFGGLSAVFSEKQERDCHIALNILRTAIKKPAVLPSLELEWQRGSVAPSVLLSILDPHMPLPPDVDLCKSQTVSTTDQPSIPPLSSDSTHDTKDELFGDGNLLFVPPELKQSALTSPSYPPPVVTTPVSEKINREPGQTVATSSDIFRFDSAFSADYYNTQADYLQLVNYQECESRATEFRHLALDLCSQSDLTLEGHDAAIDALLLAAECYVNPFFLMSFRPNSDLINQINHIRAKLTQGTDLLELNKDFARKRPDLAVVAHFENKRDRAVLDILLQATKLDTEYHKRTTSSPVQDDTGHGKQPFVEISESDMQFADAVTLVRRNQALLCDFIMRQFQRERVEEHLSSHEILLQSLLFLLQSATQLFCPPEDVIDTIIQSAQSLNTQLQSLYHQIKSEGNLQNTDMEKLHGFRRRWVLLQKLVVASSGNTNCQLRSLVPPSSWMQKIPQFRNVKQPLAWFVGWMAVSHSAKEYLNEQLFLASDFSQLTLLLSVFSEELALFDHSFQALYPDLYLFFPTMSKQFHSFGENILEAVGLQLKCLPRTSVPDILCWFSDMCLWPYLGEMKDRIGVNAKAVVLYILESVVAEHMEAMIPEMPRVAHALVSLCRAPYADVAFLESVLRLLKPLISYFVKKATGDENLSGDLSTSRDFELLSFEELFDIVSCRNKEESEDTDGDKVQMSLLIFILGSIFPDLSIKRRCEILESLLLWADFTTSGPPSSLYSYLCAFQKVMDSCDIVMACSLKSFGIQNPFDQNQSSDTTTMGSSLQDKTDCSQSGPSEEQESVPDVKILCVALDNLIPNLIPSIESSWKLHHQLALKLSQSLAKCLLLSRCLVLSASEEGTVVSNDSKCWLTAIDGLTGLVLKSQEKQCWQAASALLDYLLNSPQDKEVCYTLGCATESICSAIKYFCLHAPRISWRLQSGRWLSLLIHREPHNHPNSDSDGSSSSLVDLFSTLLSHPEPEQRSMSLQQLGRAVTLLESKMCTIIASETWNRVLEMALCDPCLLLQKRAMALLSEYVPFVERGRLQSLLQSSDTVLQGRGKLTHTTEEGHLTRLSLLLLANVCLFSPDEDISLIPESVWTNLETMGTSLHRGLSNMEKDLCRALCQLRTEYSAKTSLKEVLSSSSNVKPGDPAFSSIRETVLQVLSSLTCVESYFDFFSRKSDRESEELEEAEIEMELIQREKALQEISSHSKDDNTLPLPGQPSYEDETEVTDRLKQIKNDIRSFERSKLKEEIMARRHKKLLIRRAHQKYLEEATSREMELLQELDRERAIESEREIGRQRQLEAERQKTRELQFNVDMERERQAQRELQRELDQAESGARSSRRDYSSNPTSRTRERYRERENGRSGGQHQHEGSIRSSSRGRRSTSPTPPPTVMLSGSNRPYSSSSGHAPTVILQSSRDRDRDRYRDRDRSDDRSSFIGYEDSVESGGRDSGDANSVGDPEFGSPFDGYGSRHGSRGSKSRHVAERRERDGRREGKWERKHS